MTHDDVESHSECGDRQENAQELVEQLEQASKMTRIRIQEAEMYFRIVLYPDGKLAIAPQELMSTLIPLVFNLQDALSESHQRIAEGCDPYLALRSAHIQIVRFTERAMPGTLFLKLDMDYNQAPPPECELVFMRQAITLLIADLERIVNPV